MNMETLAQKTDLTFDGGLDNRLFADHERIQVYAPALGYHGYRRMEKEIKDFSIERSKYNVYVWNDVSGWLYWKEEGGCNYIQVTVDVINVDLSDEEIKQLKRDVETAYNTFYHYHTIEAWIETLNKRGA